MIRRLIAAVALLWVLGLIVFILTLPKPASNIVTDGVVVLTGGQGRVQRGIYVLEAHLAHRLLISGVDRDVKPHELAITYHIPNTLMSCCVDLGRQAIDTRSNAIETANWVKKNGYHSLRVVTNNWHMTRARFELSRDMPSDVLVVNDAVEGAPTIGILIEEYDKYLWRRVAVLIEDR